MENGKSFSNTDKVRALTVCLDNFAINLSLSFISPLSLFHEIISSNKFFFVTHELFCHCTFKQSTCCLAWRYSEFARGALREICTKTQRCNVRFFHMQQIAIHCHNLDILVIFCRTLGFPKIQRNTQKFIFLFLFALFILKR